MCVCEGSILQIYPLFSPQSTVRQNLFLCCTVHIYNCNLHLIFRVFLSFTHRKIYLVLSCFHIPVPHYRNGRKSGILLPSGHSGSVVMTPFQFMTNCNLNHSAFKKRVFRKKDEKQVTLTLPTCTDFPCCVFKSSVDENKRFSISNSFFKLAPASACMTSMWILKGTVH